MYLFTYVNPCENENVFKFKYNCMVNFNVIYFIVLYTKTLHSFYSHIRFYIF